MTGKELILKLQNLTEEELNRQVSVYDYTDGTIVTTDLDMVYVEDEVNRYIVLSFRVGA